MGLIYTYKNYKCNHFKSHRRANLLVMQNTAKTRKNRYVKIYESLIFSPPFLRDLTPQNQFFGTSLLSHFCIKKRTLADKRESVFNQMIFKIFSSKNNPF